MQVAVIGTGYVGLVTGACLAHLGHQVACHDVDERRLRPLRDGKAPFHEPGLDAIVAATVQAGRLRPEPELAAAVQDADVVFIAVGTPPKEDGSADLRYVEGVARDVSTLLPTGAILVTRSTVPPGTGDTLQGLLGAAGRDDVAVVSAPEFLAEGTAVRDFLEPERLLFGGPADAAAKVASLFDGLPESAPRLLTDRRTSELAKYAANTFLAARVSLINELANLCDAVGADVSMLSRAVGLDSRVGPKFLRPGIGYGGSCFPKDVQAVVALAKANGVELPVAAAAHATNEAQWRRIADRAGALLGGDVAGKRIAVLGIAFKPDTDDIREAPGLRLMAHLAGAGAMVRAHDPLARLPDQPDLAGVAQAASAEEAIQGADLVVLVTEWATYRDDLDWTAAAGAASTPLLLDARNALDHDALRAAGWTVKGVGL